MAALITTASVVVCAHGGSAATESRGSRVSVSGQSVVLIGDPYLISSCAAHARDAELGCISGQWTAGAARVRVGGSAAAITGGASITRPGASVLQVVDGQSRVTVR